MAEKHNDSCGIIVITLPDKSNLSVSNTVLARVAKLVDARDLKSFLATSPDFPYYRNL